MKRLIGIATVAVAVIALLPATVAAASDYTVTVDLGSSTGAVKHGATGWLYGLAEDGIPTDNTIAPLHPDSSYQKAPDGTQHPHGDALHVSSQLLRDGGSDVGIYMQDFYPDWPYANPGIAAYLQVIDTQARKVVADPNRSHYIYVPFNEPDSIWYSGNLTGFENDWKLAYQKIKSIDPAARIAGPNYANFYDNDYRNFFQFAKDNNVVPDVTSWHELNDSFFQNWYNHLASYRATEQAVGISPRPIFINEYGRGGDMAVPGGLVQWITRFENSKVHANLGFWSDTGSLNDLVAVNENNKVTGGWWLYKWYGEMTGNTVTVTPPTQNGPLQGVATYDSAKQQARVILGGSLNATDVFSTDVAFTHIPATFGSTVHATVYGIDNTGNVVSAGPYVSAESDLMVSGGNATMSLSGLKSLSAYEVILTPNTDTSAATTTRYEAEYADLTGAAKVQTSNHAGYSGTSYVEGYDSSSAANTNFIVNVSSDGYYDVALRYSAGPIAGAPTNRSVQVVLNGATARTLSLTGTANWDSWNTATTKLYLQGGINRITFSGAATDNSDAINLDWASVTATTGTTQTIEAEAAGNTLTGSAVTNTNTNASSGSYVGYIGQGMQNSITFNGVQASTAGVYELVVQYANNENSGGAGAGYNTNTVNRFADISINGATAQRQYFHVTGGWSTWKSAVLRVTLRAGSNTVAFGNATAWAPDLDKITIAAVAG